MSSIAAGVERRYAKWRRLGPRVGTRLIARRVGERLLTPLERLRARVAPPRVSRRATARALGGRSAAEALRAARGALPTVAAWEDELAAADGSAREALLDRAEAVLAHRFDLLGSGPTDLGPRIDWHRDFKSGRSWPPVHVSRIVTSYPDGSDIKVPWELSRFQHLPLLAAAYRLTGEERWLEEIGAQLDDWTARNPVGIGVNWACTMDVAIRAANWVAALVMCADAARDRPWLERTVGSLLLHGRFIRGNLEWGPVRGNHYLSDVVGLLVVASVFSGSRTGRRWAAWATGELEREMSHQVRSSGVDHEMSISYHRLVCELFVCGTQAADALVPGRLSAPYRERLDAMLQFASDTTRPDGLAPQVGDADSGRFLPLGDYGRPEFRSHLHLFRQASRPRPRARGHVAYPDGGFYVMRHGELWAVVRCGDVGLGGDGGHAHNDQLAFELCWSTQPLVVDPGAYLYTADPVARNAFRSTAGHATLRIGGEEQNPLRSDYLFVLEDRTRAETLAFEADGPRARFAGRHHGYERLDPPATHERELSFDGDALRVAIADTVRSAGGHELEWSLPLAPGAQVEAGGESAVAVYPSCRLTVVAPGLELVAEDGWVSPGYGVREPAPVLRARRTAAPNADRQAITLIVEQSDDQRLDRRRGG